MIAPINRSLEPVREFPHAVTNSPGPFEILKFYS
jgi:hypothetical protein